MAPRIETDEADALARALAGLTGETMAEAVTVALRERLARERARRAAGADFSDRVQAAAARLRGTCDARPVGRAEWDEASGDG